MEVAKRVECAQLAAAFWKTCEGLEGCGRSEACSGVRERPEAQKAAASRPQSKRFARTVNENCPSSTLDPSSTKAFSALRLEHELGL
jgi:hypothetical protein